MKRLFDMFFSFIAMIVLSPLLLVTALLIRVGSKGPVLFRQERIGKHGQPFIIYKFRTMVVNHGGNTVSVKGEDRITPIGARLRKWKIDELPELWNILIGDMSFVGPRPDVADYFERLEGEEHDILKVRPGLTSPASIKYSNEEEMLAKSENPQKLFDEVIWPDKTRMNLDYVKSQSFLGDIRLLVLTLFKMMK